MADVLVVGAGNQGYALAAHLALYGYKTNLWNRTRIHIQDIISSKKIEIVGAIEGIAKLDRISSDISEVITQIIFITTPSTAHSDIAKLLSPHIDDSTIIILSPGRTFGAINFHKELTNCGCKYQPKIFETQTIIHTCRKINQHCVRVFALKKDVLISSLRVNDLVHLAILPNEIQKYFKSSRSMVETSLGNIGMILHCAPMLMNIGFIESKKISFKYYFDGISRTIAKFLVKLDQERVIVAKRMGVNLETTEEWLKRTYNIKGNNLYECIQNNHAYKDIKAPKTIYHRYILEDIPNGLVPMESVGNYYDIETSNTKLIVELGNKIFDIDFRKNGRIITLEDVKDYLIH